MMPKIFHKNKYNKGFTLVELIVVISIFAILSSIMIFNYGSFKSSLSIQNLAEDIALSVRKAQGYAIGVHGYGNSFASGYGVHFSTAESTSEYAGSNKSFILFANLDDNFKYDNSSGCGTPTSVNECLEVLNITSSDKISEISVIGNGVAGHTPDTLDIFFKRPQPEPTFCAREGKGNCNFGGNVSSVKIKISNDNGISKIITISNVGQISVSNN